MEIDEKLSNTNRLDVEMHRRGVTRSRSEASDLISRKKVMVNGNLVSKASIKVSPEDTIEVTSPLRFVSRAGEKLAGALEAFKIDVTDLVAIDVGSSTGGFTDCLLQKGIGRVIAIDVGTNQFAPELRDNPRVELHEGTDVRRFSLPSPVDLAVVDVSFISLSLVLQKVYDFLKPEGRAIVLVKPQFEVGMETAKKFQGVITDGSLQKEALEKIKSAASEVGFKVLSDAVSPVEGEKGNKEFLVHLRR